MDCLTHLEKTIRRGYVPDFQREIDEVLYCSECVYQEFCNDSMKRNCELNQRGEI
jgi:hypothetical protein